MKNLEVINLSDILVAYTNQLKALKGAKFGYGLLKNLERVDKAVRSIMDRRVIEPGFEAYEKARIALCEKYGDRDEKGELLKKFHDRNNYDFVIDTHRANFDKEMEKLKKKNQELLDKQDRHQEAFNAFLQEESKLELHKIDLEHVPQDISLELLSVVKAFIND